MFEWFWKCLGLNEAPKEWKGFPSEPELPPATEDECYWWCDFHPWIPCRPGDPPRQVVCYYHTDACKKAMGDTPYSDPDEDRWHRPCQGGSTWQVDGWNYRTRTTQGKPIPPKQGK